ncbi:mannosyl-oligosaccharide1,2-alpha-mannosidase [Gracilaria domingensis]|nr:mannosyl-oligosaccharide1,2-alpha-mannosidase [Gracilaria domingensis]
MSSFLPLGLALFPLFLLFTSVASFREPHRRNSSLTLRALQYLDRAPGTKFRHCQGATVLPVGSFAPVDVGGQNGEKREKIKDAVKHAWDAYERSAWGYDELSPLSKTGQDTFAPHLATTIIDSLSTLYIMGGLEGRYQRARDWVANNLHFSNVGRVIVFETVIRILGGLLSMYHLSGDVMYLEKAENLGARLASSFDSDYGLPWPRCHLNQPGFCENHEQLGDSLYLAEVGSVQLEYRALSHHSTAELSQQLRNVSERVIEVLQQAGAMSGLARLKPPHDSLLPFSMSRTTGRYSTNLVTMGAPADSYFEYLVKVWVQGGRKEKHFWTLFERVVDSIVEIAAYESRFGDVIVRDVVVSKDGSLQFQSKMDHFSCYIPGMIVLGMDGLGENDTERREKWMWLATELTETCYKMYEKSPSGLAGENIRLGSNDEWRMSGGYNLRPEAVEAFFYMYRYTKNEKYRQYAWKVFESIEQHCKVEHGGYAAIRTAKSRHPQRVDVMHSFLIAETFKYIYLAFGEGEEIDLRQWVFNTEAHPLLISPGLSSGKRCDTDSAQVSESSTTHDELQRAFDDANTQKLESNTSEHIGHLAHQVRRGVAADVLAPGQPRFRDAVSSLARAASDVLAIGGALARSGVGGLGRAALAVPGGAHADVVHGEGLVLGLGGGGERDERAQQRGEEQTGHRGWAVEEEDGAGAGGGRRRGGWVGA